MSCVQTSSPGDLLHEELRALIDENAEKCEEERAVPRPEVGSRTWSADCILELPVGFEIWLGGLDDALDLKTLKGLGINAVVNCAVDECRHECNALGRAGCGGRRRMLAHDESLGLDGFNPGDGNECVDQDEIRATASFDAAWYKEKLACDVSYLALPALDCEGYRMEDHFSEIVSFMSSCRSENRKVLLHCMRGINRSATATVAFLCGGLNYSLRDAVDMTSKSRGSVLTNDSFLDQLIYDFGAEISENVAVEFQPPAKGACWPLLWC